MESATVEEERLVGCGGEALLLAPELSVTPHSEALGAKRCFPRLIPGVFVPKCVLCVLQHT